MSTGTLINWTDWTPNAALGCKRKSCGCDNCYAIVQAHMHAGHPNPKIAAAYAGDLTARINGRSDWTGKVTLLPERMLAPLAVRAPKKIFINSMSDLFFAGIPAEFTAAQLATAAIARWHIFQSLTKRELRMRRLLNSPKFRALYEAEWRKLAGSLRAQDPARWGPYLAGQEPPWPIPNLWLGVSAENQRYAEIRIPHLLACAGAAGLLWLSAEPALGPYTLRNLKTRGGAVIDALSGDVKSPAGEVYSKAPGSLEWVVAGGETGSKARAAHPDWLRGLRDQCAEAEVAFWLKQRGAWGDAPWRVDREPGETADEYKARAEAACATHSFPAWAHQYGMEPVKGHPPWSGERGELPEGQAPMRRWGAKKSGELLDGREHKVFPRPGYRAAA